MNHTEEWEKEFDDNYPELFVKGDNWNWQPDIKNFIKSLLQKRDEEILVKVDQIPVPQLYINGEMIPDPNFVSNRELIKQSLKEEGEVTQ